MAKGASVRALAPVERTDPGGGGAELPAGGLAVRATPPPRGPYVGKLHTVGAIRREITRLYRDSRRGLVAVQDCARWANVLFLAARLIEGQEIEARVSRLEQRAGGGALPDDGGDDGESDADAA